MEKKNENSSVILKLVLFLIMVTPLGPHRLLFFCITYRYLKQNWCSRQLVCQGNKRDGRLTKDTCIGVLSLAMNVVIIICLCPIGHYKLYYSRGGVWTSKLFLMSFKNAVLHVSISLLKNKQKLVCQNRPTHLSFQDTFSSRIIL